MTYYEDEETAADASDREWDEAIDSAAQEANERIRAALQDETPLPSG